MKFNKIYRVLFSTLTLVALTVGLVFAQDTSFRRVQLAYKISVEIPSHWKVLSQESRQNLEAMRAAMLKNAGVEGSSGEKINLLAVNATPDPTGAMIRISVTSPPDYTQTDLAAATLGDLKEVSVEMQNMLRKLEASGGPKIIEIRPVRMEKFNNHQMLVMPYIRASFNGSSDWLVTQYKIPVSNRMIEITLSHRQSDAIVWRPILERVRRSVQF